MTLNINFSPVLGWNVYRKDLKLYNVFRPVDLCCDTSIFLQPGGPLVKYSSKQTFLIGLKIINVCLLLYFRACRWWLDGVGGWQLTIPIPPCRPFKFLTFFHWLTEWLCWMLSATSHHKVSSPFLEKAQCFVCPNRGLADSFLTGFISPSCSLNLGL